MGIEDDRASLWLDRPRAVIDEPLPDDDPYDDIVVGAGLTGLVAALLLARAGRRVGVIEARHVGAVTTGHSTAKVSLLQGTKLSRMLLLNSRSVVEAYVEANREGRDWLLRFCADHGVEFQSRDAITYASTANEVAAARDEHDAARGLGLDVQWTSHLPVPFPLVGATVLPDQAQLDPMELLDALVAQVRSHGGTVHEGHRVVQVSGSSRPELTLAEGRALRADNVVLATGVPTLDRGLYFAKVEPRRSYALAFEIATPPDAMFLSAGDPVLSLRGAPGARSPRLLVGGHGHVVGRTRSEAQHVEALRDWVATYYPDARGCRAR